MSAPSRPTDYLTPLRRHKYWFLLPFLILFGIAVALSTLLPPVYEATATIQIEKQELPRDFIETSVVTGYIDEHLEVLGRKVMSMDNLWDIAQRFGIYPELHDENARHLVVSAIRSNVRREILYIEVGPEDRRGGDSVAVAFAVTFAHGDPAITKDVANALAELYVKESRDVRARQAGQLAGFLRRTADTLAERVDDYEQKLAEFKEANVASLPEFTGFNLRMLETTQDQTDRIQETINALVQQRINLQSQLSQTERRTNTANVDAGMLSAAQQVERLRLEYLRLSSRYTPRHPDFGRVRNELRTLVGETPRAQDVLDLIIQIEERRSELNASRSRHGDNHPAVESLQRQAGELRSRLTAMGREGGDGEAVLADNPAYVALYSRLQGVETEIAAERRKLQQLEQRLAAYDGRLLSGAGVEREYRALTREHEHVVREYQETRDKLLRAEVAEKIEREQMGDRFMLTSPATQPNIPAHPKRAGIAFLGFILAVGAGAGMTALAEYLDRSVRGVRGVVNAWGGPPLATIPVIRTRGEKRIRIAKTMLVWLLALGLMAAVTVLIMTYGYVL